MKDILNIAIVSPYSNAYSETFIQAHKGLKGNIFFYFGGLVPNQLENKGKLFVEGVRLAFFLLKKRFIRYTSLHYSEYFFLKSLKKNKIDVVLAEYGPTGASILKTCRLLQLPLIVHFHGFDASDRVAIEQFQSQYAEMFQYANYVIAVSHRMKCDLIALGCPDHKIVLNTYGPSHSFLKIEPSFNTRQFVSVGRFVEKKAPYLTLLAFRDVLKEFPDAKLVMCGEGELLNVCKHLCNVWGISNNVNFLGIQSQAQIQLLFSHSLAFIQHSIVAGNGDSEGAPVAILEASASGLPVISTKHAGIPDIIIDKETGFLVNEFDYLGMSEYMKILLRDPELARKLGAKGKVNIQNNFSLQKHLDTLNDHISKSIYKI